MVTRPVWEEKGMEASLAIPDQQLLEELRVERRKKEMLQTSLYELRSTVTELERKLNGAGDEGNEWRTRYETQIELNRQLEQQAHILQEKTEHIRGNPTDRLSSIRSYDQMPVGALNQYLRRLEDEKTLIENQLKDFELRIEQETKAYYKVNDERRMYISEIAQTSVVQDAVKKRAADPVTATREKPGNKGMYNVSTNQRISEKKKKPSRKTMKVGIRQKQIIDA